MLGSALPATATLQTSTSSATPSSPTRSSRLRGLSYLRNYTHNHLHSSSSRESTPPIPRSRSSNTLGANSRSQEELSRRTRRQQEGRREGPPSNESGWLPTVQGRSGLTGDSLQPESTTEAASPERTTSSSVGMSRTRSSTAALGPTPASESRSGTMRRSSYTGNTPSIDATMASTNIPGAAEGSDKPPMPTIRFIPHIDRNNSRPSLQFTAVARTLATPNSVVRVGRYSERDQMTPPPWGDSVHPVGFKSKVVSRKHCEFWHSNGQWYVKDVKSSSGTFLNHVRLSGPGVESRPYPVTDGDVVQLGIDFKGGEEVIFRCVKIRIECNRGWQKSLNSFNTSAHEKLLGRSKSSTSANVKAAGKARDSDAQSTGSSECSICLNPVAPCQALFVSPCSHVWHFKCIRGLITGPNYPNFLCPNCRFSADLEADVEPPEDYEVNDFDDVPEEVNDTDMLDEDEDRNESGGVDVSDEDTDARGGDRNGDDSQMEDIVEGTSTLNIRQHDPEIIAGASRGPSPRPTASGSKQIPIPSPIPTGSRSPDPTGGRATTPKSNTPFALAAGIVPMPGGRAHDREEEEAPADTNGPMTPRNDAGPFVIDGAGEQGRGNAVDAGRVLQGRVGFDE